jgi:hypothetical protein
MEAARSFESSVNFYLAELCYNPEGRTAVRTSNTTKNNQVKELTLYLVAELLRLGIADTKDRHCTLS